MFLSVVMSEWENHMTFCWKFLIWLSETFRVRACCQMPCFGQKWIEYLMCPVCPWRGMANRGWTWLQGPSSPMLASLVLCLRLAYRDLEMGLCWGGYGRGARSKPGEHSTAIFFSRSWKIFSVKGQIAFAGLMVSVATIQLHCCGMKAVVEDR